MMVMTNKAKTASPESQVTFASVCLCFQVPGVWGTASARERLSHREMLLPWEVSLEGFALYFSLSGAPSVEDTEAKVWSRQEHGIV